ncbi:VTT domain-containing protein [Streptomyces sp. NPDC005438]|uniref:DedA family protein n=1 Tax=Streptomyces sp. NPDC005438 TaxID=3156880 RepID=UPI0033B284BF
MLETLGSWSAAPWIYLVVVSSVLLDVFLPVLPSGVLVVTAATAAASGTATGLSHALPGPVPEVFTLLACAATSSVIGDLIAWQLAWHGGPRVDSALGRLPRLAKAQRQLGHAVVRGGGALVVVARFAPAGRSVVSLMSGAARRRARDFLPWSALAGMIWACYGVGVGYFGSHWFGHNPFSTVLSVLALFAAGSFAAFLIRRAPREVADTPLAMRPAPPPEDEPASRPEPPAQWGEGLGGTV